MKYFNLKELCASATASAYNIDNIPDVDSIVNLEYLVENILDPLREFIKHPIYVSSGYRSEIINRMIQGATNSQHKYGCAADIYFMEDDAYCTLVYLILTCPFMPYHKFIDQCILYQRQCFIHVSIAPDRNPRKDFLMR